MPPPPKGVVQRLRLVPSVKADVDPAAAVENAAGDELLLVGEEVNDVAVRPARLRCDRRAESRTQGCLPKNGRAFRGLRITFAIHNAAVFGKFSDVCRRLIVTPPPKFVNFPVGLAEPYNESLDSADCGA